MRNKRFFFVPLAIVGFAAFIFIGGFVVMHLWNWLLPPLFGWKLLTFWQALALLVLCRLLFGRIGGRGFRGRGGPPWRRHGGRWEQMSPEEREKMRQAFRGCWGSANPSTAPSGSVPNNT